MPVLTGAQGERYEGIRIYLDPYARAPGGAAPIPRRVEHGNSGDCLMLTMLTKKLASPETIRYYQSLKGAQCCVPHE
jgi:hypothetical protein